MKFSKNFVWENKFSNKNIVYFKLLLIKAEEDKICRNSEKKRMYV